MNATALSRALAEQLNPMIGCCTEDSLNNAASAIGDLSYLLSSGDYPSTSTFLLFGAVVAALRYESANLLPARQKEGVTA